MWSNTPTVKLSDDGFSQKVHFKTEHMAWNEVTEITGLWTCQITYDEDFLILRSGDKYISVGELDNGFAEFENQLLKKFPDFPENWRTIVEGSQYDVRYDLWKRA